MEMDLNLAYSFQVIGSKNLVVRLLRDLADLKQIIAANPYIDGIGQSKESTYLEAAVGYAELAAAHPPELVASTKATFAAGMAVTESNEAVTLEITPQIHSMQQPAFLEMLGALKARIEKKG